jgi:hypothetical protein
VISIVCGAGPARAQSLCPIGAGWRPDPSYEPQVDEPTYPGTPRIGIDTPLPAPRIAVDATHGNAFTVGPPNCLCYSFAQALRADGAVVVDQTVPFDPLLCVDPTDPDTCAYRRILDQEVDILVIANLTFLEPRGDSVVPAGWSSGWAFDHGLGHVYASSEASMFTSQLGYGGSGGADGEGGMQSYPNNQKYLLNILHWMDDLLPDPDGGGLYDGRDNCTAIANATQCDSDQDGYGNYCDGDFNQNGTVASNDYGHYFVPDQTAGTDSGTGTDMNCDGVVDAIDYSDYFVPQLGSGYPGPSGYACAGTMPCP